MGARAIIHSGSGGAGRTTLALATAQRVAAAGRRTLLLSLDPAAGLGPALGRAVGAEPVEIAPRLEARQAAAESPGASRWPALAHLAGAALTAPAGEDPVADLTAAPGAADVLALLELAAALEPGGHEIVVVDAPPTDATLRLLAVPGLVRRWLATAAPQAVRGAAASRPLARLLGGAALEEAQVATRALLALDDALGDHDATLVRLAVAPDARALPEARRAATALALGGVALDAVVVNRAPDDPREAAAIASGLRPLTVLEAPRLAAGGAPADLLGDALFGGRDAAAPLGSAAPEELVAGPDAATLRLALPFARREDVAVRLAGDELLVRVGGRSRALALPPALGDYRPTGAVLEDGALLVTFDRRPADA